MNWDYIAGFVDGEGSIIRLKRSFNVVISQTNFKVLDEIRRFIGNGYVYSLTKRKVHWKDAWIYNTGGSRETYYLLSFIAPRLVVKKNLAFQALNELKKRFSEIEDEKRLRARRLREGKVLRKKGLTYRAIGRKLNADFGYIRRLILGKI